MFLGQVTLLGNTGAVNRWGIQKAPIAIVSDDHKRNRTFNPRIRIGRVPFPFIVINQVWAAEHCTGKDYRRKKGIFWESECKAAADKEYTDSCREQPFLASSHFLSFFKVRK
jgi:hypothetical protein